MVKVSIETIGEERFIRGFNRIPKEMADMRSVFQDISLDFYEIEKRIFARGGFPIAFQKLSTKYAAWKNKHHSGKKIMQLKGRLRLSLVDPDRAKAGDVIKKIGKTFAEFGSSIPYAHRHQMGTKGMPQRKIVWLMKRDKVRWGRMIHQWALNVIKKELQ